MQSLLDAAIGYAQRGWPVFPLRERGKVPLVAGGFQAATTDEKTIRVWWSRWPNANIGMPTGKASGVAAIDIDPRHGGDECIAQLIERHGEPPETPKSRTGGGGFHLLFKYEDGFRNSAGAIGAGIDTRGDGGYIVLPPSLHESGREYAWEDDADPETIPTADLPAWLNPAKSHLGQLQGAALPMIDVKPKPNGAPVAEGGRNVAAASLAGQFITAGDSLTEVMRKIKAWNDTNVPPMPDSEVEKTVASVARTHVRKHPGVELPVIDVVPDLGDVEEVQPEIVPLPSHLLEPPGMIGEICRWMNDTAIKPQPELALGNALAFFGAVIGRKVRTPTDLRSNIYVLGVGESGCGKDHSRKCIKKLCASAGLTSQLLGGEEVSSDSAIITAVHLHPSILFQFDEIGHFLANASSKYAASHQKNIAPTFTKLFSSAATTLIGKEYAGAERKDVDQPNVCLYGTTVPGRLYEGLTPGEISDGFLGRMIVFQSADADPIEREVAPTSAPVSIVETVQAWFNRKDLPQADGNIASRMEHIPITVEFEEEAMGIMRKFRGDCREMKTQHRDGSGLDVLWSRAAEHAAKVAMVLACGCQFQSPLVSASIASYSVELIGHLVNNLVATVSQSVAGSDYERDVLFVKRIIRETGKNGIMRSVVLRKARRIKSSNLDEIINRLISTGEVIKAEVKNTKGPGRPTTRFLAK
jgi:hypothetical protein